jgi:hypothetical protein
MKVFEVTHKITRTETRRIVAKDFEGAAKIVSNLNVVGIRLVDTSMAVHANKIRPFSVKYEFMEYFKSDWPESYELLNKKGFLSPKDEVSLFKNIPTGRRAGSPASLVIHNHIKEAAGDFLGGDYNVKNAWKKFKKKYPEETKNYRLRKMYRGPRPQGNQSYCLKKDATRFSLYIHKEWSPS